MSNSLMLEALEALAWVLFAATFLIEYVTWCLATLLVKVVVLLVVWSAC